RWSIPVTSSPIATLPADSRVDDACRLVREAWQTAAGHQLDPSGHTDPLPQTVADARGERRRIRARGVLAADVQLGGGRGRPDDLVLGRRRGDLGKLVEHERHVNGQDLAAARG